MLTKDQAKDKVEEVYPGATAEAVVVYKGLYLVRVTHPDPDEGNWDPFYAVHPEDGKVAEFSVTADATPAELAALFTT